MPQIGDSFPRLLLFFLLPLEPLLLGPGGLRQFGFNARPGASCCTCHPENTAGPA